MWRLTAIVLAFVTAIAPLPAQFIEREYSMRVYPALQQKLTSVSNAFSFALFDVLLAVLLALAVVLLIRRGRILNLLTLAACIWLVFLMTWGLNYRRVPLAEKLSFDDRRLTSENVVRMTRLAIAQMNRLHDPAHAAAARTPDDEAAALSPALDRAAQRLEVEGPVPGRPKQTWLAPYFRRAGIDGMTDPFFLETLLASDLVDIERPAALAHEWGHLAGFADESEASFFGWLTCLSGDARAQYSGWVGLYPHLLGAVAEDARAALHRQLGPGPREDFRRIAARLDQTDPRIRAAASGTYDKFLKVNRVAEGIESYDAVVRLVIGTPLGQSAPGAR